MTNDPSVQRWLRKILLEWQMSVSQLALILGVEESRVHQVLHGSDDEESGTIPSGFDAAPAMIRIFQLLSSRYTSTEEQLKWLFSEHPDFGRTKPIDVISSSRENLFWVAYYLESALSGKSESEEN